MTGAKVTLRSWRRILALGLAASMAATAIPLQLMAAQETVQESQTTGSVTEGYASERIDNGYAKISAGYALPEYTVRISAPARMRFLQTIMDIHQQFR